MLLQHAIFLSLSLSEVFCMVSLIENGLQIAGAFEYKDFCGPIQLLIRNILRFLFTFIQYCFLFRHSNVSAVLGVLSSSWS